LRAWDPQFTDAQLRAENYRAFLRGFFIDASYRKCPKVLSYQEFATRAGFASKAFLNDVIAGKKRLTPSSIGKAAVGLGLNVQWADYLKYLVASEEPAFQSKQQPREYFLKRLSGQREKLLRSKRAKRVSALGPIATFLDQDFPDIYAALGDVVTGETVTMIAARANLPKARVEEVLEKMAQTGFAKTADSGRYIPLVEALEADTLGTSEVFKADFFRSLEKAKRRFDTQANSKSSLFMVQTISVSKSQLPKLREKMAELIVEFADSAENAAGDAVAEICVGFTHNR